VVKLLQQGETLSASTEVRVPADRLYAMITDVTQTPRWSPEVTRAEWISDREFRAWNRRRLGRWQTTAKIVDTQHERQFSYVVQALGGDWTQWTYVLEPARTPGVTRLTEVFRMCVPLPWTVVAFERMFLFVRDRRSDLQANLQASVERIRDIAESQVTR
jgi:hypothetical protein